MAKLSEIFRATAEAIDASTTKVNAHNEAMTRYLGVLGQVAAAQSSLANDSAASAQRLLQQPTVARQSSSSEPNASPGFSGNQGWFFQNGAWTQAPIGSYGTASGAPGPSPSGGASPSAAGAQSSSGGPIGSPDYEGGTTWTFRNGVWSQTPNTLYGAGGGARPALGGSPTGGQSPPQGGAPSSSAGGPISSPDYEGGFTWVFRNGVWTEAANSLYGAGGGTRGGAQPSGTPGGGGSTRPQSGGPIASPDYEGGLTWVFRDGVWQQVANSLYGVKPEGTSPQQAGNYTPPPRIAPYNFGTPHTLNGRGASTDQGAPNPATVQTKGDSAIVSEVAKVGTAIKNLTTSMNRDPGNLRFRTAGLV